MDTTGNGTYNGNKLDSLKQQVGGYMHEAVGGIREAAHYVRENDVAAMRDDMAAQVRAHPLLTVALGLGLGYLVGRLLK